MKKPNFQLVALFIGFSLCLLFFQNCSPGFEPTSTSQSSLDDGNQPADPPVTPPPPRPTLTLSETRIFMGANGAVVPLKINHLNGQVNRMATVNVGSSVVGWINYEPSTKTLITLDHNLPGMSTKLRFDPNSDNLVMQSNDTNVGIGVHGALVKGNSSYFLYTADYNSARLLSYNLGPQLLNFASLNAPVNYGSNARTHSTTYDESRRILFVANLGLNQIQIYRVNKETGQLTDMGSQTVATPRMVFYEKQFGKLYLMTESTMNNSQMLAYSINDNGNTVTLTQSFSVPVPLIGADIKVNHKFRYLMGTVRQAGQEAIWGIPLSATGDQDLTRQMFTIAVNRVQPRSLEITDDGQYAVVAMNSNTTSNIHVYKLNFDASSQFQSSQLVFQDLFPQGFVSSQAVGIYK